MYTVARKDGKTSYYPSRSTPTTTRRKKIFYRKKKPMKKKEPITQKLVRQVKTLMSDQYDNIWLRFNSSIATTVSPLNFYNIIDPTQYTRLFTAGTDTPYTSTAWLNKIIFNYRFQLNENTPDTFPIYITCFLISPKWQWREILGSTSATQLSINSFTAGTTHSYGSQSAQSVLLNNEYMKVLGRKRFVLMPPIKAIGGTAETYPNSNYYRTGSFKINPRLKLKGASRTWKDITADDIPFTRQLGFLFFVSFNNDAAPSTVNMNFWFDIMAKVNQVNG